mmetsp:Transcript_40592/g.79057  ORF Transcript_40592/g.79057 Transcript_40592/m.79057 type:complete len:223 (-) Transcript_40592:383-1051(-)
MLSSSSHTYSLIRWNHLASFCVHTQFSRKLRPRNRAPCRYYVTFALKLLHPANHLDKSPSGGLPFLLVNVANNRIMVVIPIGESVKVSNIPLVVKASLNPLSYLVRKFFSLFFKKPEPGCFLLFPHPCLPLDFICSPLFHFSQNLLSFYFPKSHFLKSVCLCIHQMRAIQFFVYTELGAASPHRAFAQPSHKGGQFFRSPVFSVWWWAAFSLGACLRRNAFA